MHLDALFTGKLIMEVVCCCLLSFNNIIIPFISTRLGRVVKLKANLKSMQLVVIIFTILKNLEVFDSFLPSRGSNVYCSKRI